MSYRPTLLNVANASYHRYDEFLDRLSHGNVDAEEFGVPDVLSIRLGGNDFLHREAVTAGGMHSCSSVACSIYNWLSDVVDRTRQRQIEVR
jgi:hypothetical protein